MKEKKIRRILVIAILAITAVSIIVKFNIKAPTTQNTAIVNDIDKSESNNNTDADDGGTAVDNTDNSDAGSGEADGSSDNTDGSGDDSNQGSDANKDEDNSGDDGNTDNGDVDKPSDDDEDKDEDPINYITVYMTIDATLLADGEALRANNHENKIQYTGDNGIIAARVAVKVPENASVYDALHTFCLEHDIQMEASGTSFGTAYIRGINHLYEFDGGISSGWVFLVNNVYATSGASNVHLEEGDEVRWFYTLAFGKDVS